MKISPGVTLIFLLTFGFGNTALGQSTENIPTPASYGVYALIDGKLCAIGSKAKCGLKSGDFNIGWRTVVGTEVGAQSTQFKAVELQQGTRFVIYQEKLVSFADGVNLIPMVFVRNIAVHRDEPDIFRGAATENAWDVLAQSDLNGEKGKLSDLAAPIQMQVTTIKPNMILAVPSREFTPGLYYLALGPDIRGVRIGVYFYFGSVTEVQSLKCVDVKYDYSVNLFNRKYSLCGEQAVTETKVPKDTSGSATQDVLNELVDVAWLATEAQVRGDKGLMDSLLAEEFTSTGGQLGGHWNWNREKFLKNVKRDDTILSYRCGEYKLNLEGEIAVLSGICEYAIEYQNTASYFSQSRILRSKAEFKHRLVKRGNKWLFVSSDTHLSLH